MNKKSHIVYKKPILDEVIFEARFPIRLNLEKYIGDLQEKIEKFLPIVEENITQKIIFSQINKDNNPISGVKFWVFKDENTSKFVVSRNKIAISSKKYHSWENHDGNEGFFEFIKKIVSIFNSIYKIPTFKRIGLRYINKYGFTTEKYTSVEFTKLFVPVYNIKNYALENLRENMVRLQINHENDNKLTIQSIFQYDNDDLINYFLDFDGYCINKTFEELWTKLSELHDAIQLEFEKLIEKNLRDEMEPYDK